VAAQSPAEENLEKNQEVEKKCVNKCNSKHCIGNVEKF
jgi:hypothetical protein